MNEEKPNVNGSKPVEKVSIKVSRYVFLALLVLVVLESVYSPEKTDKLKEILSLMVELNIYTFIAVLVGSSRIDKIANMFNNYRKRK